MNRAGRVTKPPPPAMASKKPASKAMVARANSVAISISILGYPGLTANDERIWLKHQRLRMGCIGKKSDQESSVVLNDIAGMECLVIVNQERRA
ncbi:hypothetical protein KU43P_47830 [Pseudomonas sp. KU43P]|nr:hypothetical protein KU43P_47830 [Pseudomonas sp. KU43P]